MKKYDDDEIDLRAMERIPVREILEEHESNKDFDIICSVDTLSDTDEEVDKYFDILPDDYDSHPEDDTQDYDDTLSDRAAFEDQYEKEYWEFVDDYEDSEREKRLQKELSINESSCYEPNETREDTNYHNPIFDKPFD